MSVTKSLGGALKNEASNYFKGAIAGKLGKNGAADNGSNGLIPLDQSIAYDEVMRQVYSKTSNINANYKVRKVENGKVVVYDRLTGTAVANASSNQTSAKTASPKSDVAPVFPSLSEIGGSSEFSIIFPSMPVISESGGNAVYSAVQGLIHHPGEILKYEHTQAIQFTISAKFISQTPNEAFKHLRYLNILRGWKKPYFGYGTAMQTDDLAMREKLGAPPPILMFNAYGEKMIDRFQCVMENASWSFPNDCDYIAAWNPDSPYSSFKLEKPIPFPSVINVEITLKEAWTPNQFSKFNIYKYKSGDIFDSYNSNPTTAPVK